MTTKAECGKDGVETCVCANDKSHTDTRVVKAPSVVHEWWQYHRVPVTCTTDGYVVWECRKCGATEKRDIVKASHQNPTTLYSIKDATCTEAGIDKKFCKECGETWDKDIDPLQHFWPKTKVIVSPDWAILANEIMVDLFKSKPVAVSCFRKQGLIVYCKRCNEPKYYEWPDSPPLDPHVFETVPDSTVKENGVTYYIYKCSKWDEGCPAIEKLTAPKSTTTVPPVTAKVKCGLGGDGCTYCINRSCLCVVCDPDPAKCKDCPCCALNIAKCLCDPALYTTCKRIFGEASKGVTVCHPSCVFCWGQ